MFKEVLKGDKERKERKKKRMYRRKILKKCAVMFLAAVLLIGSLPCLRVEGTRGTAQENGERAMFFELTKEEENYLSTLSGRTLFLGACEDGIWVGDAVEYGAAAPLLDVLLHEFGLEVEIVLGTWEENSAALKEGELDFLIGVPAVWREEESESSAQTTALKEEDTAQDDSKGNLYVSEWLRESPYVLVEYVGEPPLTEGEGKTEKAACVFGNPVAEELFSLFSGVIGSFIKADGKDVSRPGEVSVLSCAGEDAVFDALKDGSAAVAVLPEDALFSRYPATEFNVIYRFSQISGREAIGTMDSELAPLLKILDRYLSESQEGDLLREAIFNRQQNIRQEKIFAREKKVLKELKAGGGVFGYAQVGLDAMPSFWCDKDGEHGKIADFLLFVMEVTGLSFERDGFLGAKAVQALDDGDILFAVGMPTAGGEQTYCYAAILQDWLIPVVAAKDGAAFGGGEAEVQKALAQRYWGVVQDFLPLLSGTAFDGRTVGFSDGQALYEAFEKGEGGGMLTGQENYDALLLSGGDFLGVSLKDSYVTVPNIRLPIASGLAFAEENQREADFFSRLWQFYRNLHTEEEIAGQFRLKYEKAEREIFYLVRALCVCGAVLVLFLAVLIIRGARVGKSARRK